MILSWLLRNFPLPLTSISLRMLSLHKHGSLRLGPNDNFSLVKLNSAAYRTMTCSYSYSRRSNGAAMQLSVVDCKINSWTFASNYQHVRVASFEIEFAQVRKLLASMTHGVEKIFKLTVMAHARYRNCAEMKIHLCDAPVMPLMPVCCMTKKWEFRLECWARIVACSWKQRPKL
jgi:hypothetical protein